MDFGLTTEQQMVVDTVRGFVEKELCPHEEEVERTGRVPPELGEAIKRKVIDLDFYAPNLPVEVGGGGLDNLTFALLERELGRTSMALSVFWGRPSGILMGCEGEQRDRYLYPARAGASGFDALAMTEPGAGSDVRGMQCTGRSDGDDWIVNGTKHFISHADLADFVIVFIATGEEGEPRAGRRKRITCFLVDRGTPGFEIRPGYDSVSHRGYHNCILTFDDCRLPSAQILGEVHRGFELANEWLYATRITVAAMCVGRARRVFDLALSHAAERRQFGQPIGRFQGVSFKLAGHDHRDRRGGLADPRLRVAPRPGPAGGPRDRLGQGLRLGDAGAGNRRGDPDPRRHGVLMSGPSARAVSGATPASSASGTAPPRFNATSSGAICCDRWVPDPYRATRRQWLERARPRGACPAARSFLAAT